MIIDYLGHSGFLAETEDCLLLFDYYRGKLLPLVDSKPAGKPLFVFASHAHPDHFNPAVFSLRGRGRSVRYLLSFDIRGNRAVPADADVLYLDADRSYEVAGLGTVTTLLSTDEGVAFLVQTRDAAVFHAGDLNWWDWEGEDPEWLADQERVFKRETGKLAGIPLDAAFLVLDDRLERNFAEGINWFLSVCSPRCVLPMHFWKDRSVIDRFLALPERNASSARILDTARETRWEI